MPAPAKVKADVDKDRAAQKIQGLFYLSLVVFNLSNLNFPSATTTTTTQTNHSFTARENRTEVGGRAKREKERRRCRD